MATIMDEFKETQKERMKECIEMAQEATDVLIVGTGPSPQAIAQMAVAFYEERINYPKPRIIMASEPTGMYHEYFPEIEKWRRVAEDGDIAEAVRHPIE